MNNSMVKRIVDVCMTVLLLCLMAYQVTGEQAHEWIGMGMTVLVIIHQILNRRGYGAIFKGRYTAYRILSTAVNLLLIITFALTAFSGMSMSGYAVPFLYGMQDYLFFRVQFAFLDYEKPAASVFLENILMLLFWAFAGARAALLCRKLSD